MAKYRTLFGIEAIAFLLLALLPLPPSSNMTWFTPLTLVGAIVASICWIIALLDNGSTGPCNCADCTAARYDRDAKLMREITRHQNTHTEMMRSEIDHARTYGEYRERPDIAEHEQKLRDMRSRLG